MTGLLAHGVGLALVLGHAGVHLLNDIGTDRAGEDGGNGVGGSGGSTIFADDGDGRSRSHCEGRTWTWRKEERTLVSNGYEIEASSRGRRGCAGRRLTSNVERREVFGDEDTIHKKKLQSISPRIFFWWAETLSVEDTYRSGSVVRACERIRIRYIGTLVRGGAPCLK